MNILRKASHVFVAGKSGKGKTTFAERYLIGSHHDRVFIFDHQGEFSLRLKCPTVRSFGEMRDALQSQRVLCYDFAQDAEANGMADSFDDFCAEVFSICKFYLEPHKVESLLVCDEIQKVTGPYGIPEPFRNVIETGRRYNLDTLTMSQQPNAVHNSLRNQVTEMVLFNLGDENSLKFARERGLDPDDVLLLPDLHYNWYQMDRGEKRSGVLRY